MVEQGNYRRISTIRKPRFRLPLEEALRTGESGVVEFKSSFQWDLRRNQYVEERRLDVLKAIAGFLNAKGGTLYIGVSEETDPPQLRGLDEDLKYAGGSRDKLQRTLRDLITTRIGPEFSPLITASLDETAGRLCWTLAVQESPEPAIYVPYNMATVPGTTFLLKTAVDPLSIVRAARERARSVAADLPVTEVRTLEEYLSRFERAYPRFSMTLFSIFAVVALLLAATGLYSVVSYTVAQRTHEFGIRMALGAQRGHVLRLVAGSMMALIAVGTVIGLTGSIALSRVISRFIEGWNPRDPVAYATVAAVLLFTGLLACWFPAHRATAIDPMTALRRD